MTIPIRGKVITSRVQPVYEGPPVAPLPTPSESAWKRVSKDSEEDVVRKVKELRSVLNKITLQTFDRLYKQIYEIEITNKEVRQDPQTPLRSGKFFGRISVSVRPQPVDFVFSMPRE